MSHIQSPWGGLSTGIIRSESIKQLNQTKTAEERTIGNTPWTASYKQKWLCHSSFTSAFKLRNNRSLGCNHTPRSSGICLVLCDEEAGHLLLVPLLSRKPITCTVELPTFTFGIGQLPRHYWRRNSWISHAFLCLVRRVGKNTSHTIIIQCEQKPKK